MDLDGDPNAQLQTRERMLALLTTEDEDTLWFDHGLVPGFQVSNRHAFCPHVLTIIGPALHDKLSTRRHI